MKSTRRPLKPDIRIRFSMCIVINGESREVPEGLTVLALLKTLDLDPEHVAVELDTAILKKPHWPERVLHPGARLEIVHFVGGG